ncbi:MAG: hypothetical protein RL077_1984 [Verrucomicrobiota bacterium]
MSGEQRVTFKADGVTGGADGADTAGVRVVGGGARDRLSGALERPRGIFSF